MSATEWVKIQNSKIGKINSKKGESFRPNVGYVASPTNKLGEMKMKVEVKEMPSFHVAYVPNLEGYDVEKINRAWHKLCNWAEARGLINGETKFIGISFDDPEITEKDKCRCFIGVR